MSSDARSLTLPKATSRTKLRLRKPKKPSGWFLYYAAFLVWCAGFAIYYFLTGAPLQGATMLIGVAIYWHLARIAYRTGRPVRERWVFAASTGWLALTFALLIAGVS